MLFNCSIFPYSTVASHTQCHTCS